MPRVTLDRELLDPVIDDVSRVIDEAGDSRLRAKCVKAAKFVRERQDDFWRVSEPGSDVVLEIAGSLGNYVTSETGCTCPAGENDVFCYHRLIALIVRKYDQATGLASREVGSSAPVLEDLRQVEVERMISWFFRDDWPNRREG